MPQTLVCGDHYAFVTTWLTALTQPAAARRLALVPD
jgi:hypothetical protein